MIELNYIGLKCPLPVIKAYKLLKNKNKGEKYKFLCDDPSSLKDFKNFCINTGYTFISAEKDKEKNYKIVIKT